MKINKQQEALLGLEKSHISKIYEACHTCYTQFFYIRNTCTAFRLLLPITANQVEVLKIYQLS